MRIIFDDYLGQWGIDPSVLKKDVLSAREIDRLIKMTSNTTLLEMIASMPLRDAG